MTPAGSPRLSRKWQSQVWATSLLVSALLGGLTGFKILETFSGAILGAICGFPVGAPVALILVGIGAACLNLLEMTDDSTVTRIAFSAILGISLAVILSFMSIIMLDTIAESVSVIAFGGVLGLVYGYFRPPVAETSPAK